MINNFEGNYRFLSNFYEHPIEYEGIIYRSSEAAFQAAKTLLVTERGKFAHLTPGAAKRAGRGKDPKIKVTLRKDWDTVKYDVMAEIVHIKFSNPRLKAQLLGTGDEALIEGNFWHDNVWGACSCSACATKPKLNWLGIILMNEREKLKDVSWKT